MNLESILWDAFKIVISLAIGWALGNLYAISLIRSKKKRLLNKEPDNGDYLPKFLRRKNPRKNIKRPGSCPDFEIATYGDPRKT